MGRRGQHQQREPGPLQQQPVLQKPPDGGFQDVKSTLQIPFFNLDPFQ